MQPSNGGDGSSMGPTGEAPLETAPPIVGDVSETPEELALKIESELDLPHVPVKKTEAPVEPEEPTEPVDPEEPLEPEGEEPAEDPEEPEAPVEPATPSDEELFITVEDGDGVTHKISKLEDLPEDFQYKNSRQPLEILRQIDKLEADIKDRDENAASEAAAKEAAETTQKQFDSWDKEIDNLAKDKRIDAKDTERVNKVFEHIAQVNANRSKVGNQNFITSFEDGLDKLEAAEAKEAEAAKAKEASDLAKKKSGIIGGGGSEASAATRPYVSGTARSMDDIVV